MSRPIAIGFILALLVLGVGACSSNPAPPPTTNPSAPSTNTPHKVNDFSELPKGTASHVDVIYFHRTVRCEACLNAESYTRETLDRYFVDQVKSGLITFQVLDMEKTENAALVKKFDAAGSSLFFGVQLQGAEYLCPNSDIWFFTSNKYLFVDTLRKKITSLVGGA